MRPSARAVAQSVAAWRERRAMRTDVPVRQVLPDLAILGISQRAPSTLKELSQARGVDDRHARGGIADEILDSGTRREGSPTADAPAVGGRPRPQHAPGGHPGVGVGGPTRPRRTASIRRCSPLGPTSWRSCAVTTTRDWAPDGETSWSATASAGSSAVRRGSRSTPRDASDCTPCPTESLLGRPVEAGRRTIRRFPRNARLRRYPVPECQLSSVWEPCREEGSSSPFRRGEKTEAVRSGSLRSGFR